MKRIFTVCIEAPELQVEGEASQYDLAFATFVPQEDIVVVGCELAAWLNKPSENDGRSTVEVEISQSGKWAQAGSLIRVAGYEYWNSAPAFGDIENPHLVMMFPKGHGVPISEGTTLYVNVASNGKTAGIAYWRFAPIVYYIKGKITQG